MDTGLVQKLRLEVLLGIIALASAALLCVMIVLCLPYFGAEEVPPETTAAPTTEPTTQPTTEAPTEPTLPSPESNPYGPLDFQFEGRYLKCQLCDSISGVDVSAHQGRIDWQLVASSGIDFAMIRVGYRGYETGKLTEDKYARANLEGAKAAGLQVGVYFFSQAVSVEEALEEAAFVMEIIEDYDINLPVVYDWEYISDTARTAEVDPRTLTDCTMAYCDALAEAGYSPMVYFNSYQARKQMYLWELEAYPFWLALYSSRMTYPYRIEMWQYTNTGSVPGIQGNVDLNVMFLDQ